MTALFLHDALSYLSVGFSIVAATLGLVYFPHLNQRMKLFLLFLFFSILSDILNLIIIYEDAGNNNTWLNLYTIGEFTLLSIFFSVFLKENKYYTLINALLIAAFAFIIYIIIDQGIATKMNSVAMGTESLIFISLSVATFYTMLFEMEYESPFQNPVFWLNAAILIYFAGAFFSFIFSSAKVGGTWIWVIHNFVHFIFTTLILVSYWKARKT